jgi:hypothetical protein
MFGLRLPLVTSLIAAGFLLIAVLLGTLYLLAPHVTLRITTGPAGHFGPSCFIVRVLSAERSSGKKIIHLSNATLCVGCRLRRANGSRTKWI